MYMEMERTDIAKETLKMKNKVGEHVLPDFENYYKTVVIKVV